MSQLGGPAKQKANVPPSNSSDLLDEEAAKLRYPLSLVLRADALASVLKTNLQSPPSKPSQHESSNCSLQIISFTTLSKGPSLFLDCYLKTTSEALESSIGSQIQFSLFLSFFVGQGSVRTTRAQVQPSTAQRAT